MRMVVVVVLGAFCVGACGTEAEPISKRSEPAQSVDRAAEIAPNVGQPRQERVDALRRVLAPRLDRSGQGLEAEELAGGARAVKLEGRFGHAALARKRADGSIERSCFGDTESA